MRHLDIKRLAGFFRRKKNIAAATLFGSARDGDVKESSDVDVGVLFLTPATPRALMRLMEELPDVCGTDRIDMVDLDRAHPILAMEAIKGRVLCRNRKERYATFSSLVAREYEDEMAQIEHQYALRRQQRRGKQA